jgi:16S rRNA (guanine1516-N2)-methyltransferase
MKLGVYSSQAIPDYLKIFFEEVSESLELEILKKEPENQPFFLVDEKGLSFIDEQLGKLHLDFVQDHIRYQRKGHRGKSELIAKALGLDKKTDRVIDATVGLAGDALFLVQLGYSVLGFERSPLVYLLLQDAIFRWNKAKRDSTGDFKVQFQDSILGFEEKNVKAIYIDPMFPEKKKTALPKKEMQIFKKWIGEDLDGEELLKIALRSEAERVVVKRPLKAEALLPGVVHSFKGTTVRYDLYTPRST